MIRQNTFILMLSFALFVTAGCTPYVNIPSQTGDIATHDPNKDTVAKVEAVALQAVAEDASLSGPYLIRLPVHTWPATHDRVVELIGGQADWSNEADPSKPLLDVRQLRIRGWFAQVDIVRPMDINDPASTPRLATVELKWDAVAGWVARDVRVWGMPVERALVQSRVEAEQSMGQER